MSPKEHMERYARRVPGGGIAWEQAVFQREATWPAVRLVDAAVDIAWERLLGRAMSDSRLAINMKGRLLIFRLEGVRRDPELPLVA